MTVTETASDLVDRLRATHKDYSGPQGEGWWRLVRDAFQGSGGFRVAVEACATSDARGPGDYDQEDAPRIGRTYVTRYPRERYPAFVRRVQTATYTNFTAPVVREYAGHLWRALPQREGPEELLRFWRDVDGQGSGADVWMQRTTRRAQLFGWALALVDRPPGVRPAGAGSTFARLLSPEDVRDWEFAEDGALAWLKTAVETCERDPLTGVEVERETVTIWDRAGFRRFVLEEREDDTWALVEDSGYLPHPCGRVPVAVLCWGEPEESGRLYGVSQVDGIVAASLELFNLGAELREWERGQNFAVLCVQSSDPDALQNIRIGVHGGIRVEPGMAMPTFAAPPASIGAHLIARTEGVISRIYAEANLERTSAEAGDGQVSGVSRAYKFTRARALLTGFARSVEAFERQLAALVLAWDGAAGEYRVAYPSDFDVADLATQLQVQFDALAKRDELVPEIARAARRALARALVADATPTEQGEIEASIARIYDAERRAFDARTAAPTPPAGTAPAGASAPPAGDAGLTTGPGAGAP